MKKHSTANTLLVELLLVILFFMLCVSTLVELFGLARQKSAYARAENQAMMKVENAAALLAEDPDTGAGLQKEGFAPSEEGWLLQEELYRITAVETTEKTESGSLRTVTFSAEQKQGKELFQLPVVDFFPGEVSP